MVGVEWSDRWAESQAALWPSKARPLSGPAVPAEGDGSCRSPHSSSKAEASGLLGPLPLLPPEGAKPASPGGWGPSLPPATRGRSVLCCQRGWPWPLPGVVFSQEWNFYLSYLYLYACGRAEGGRRCSSCLPYLTPLNRTGPASSCFSGVAGLGQCHTRHQVGRDPQLRSPTVHTCPPGSAAAQQPPGQRR